MLPPTIIAGTLINLLIGVLYTWGLFKLQIARSHQLDGSFDWPEYGLNDPFALCCLLVSAGMLISAYSEERLRPRLVIAIGALLISGGFMTGAASDRYGVWTLVVGPAIGLGMGLVYSTVVAATLRWYRRQRAGLAVGVVISGFGAAPILMAPLAEWLLTRHGMVTALQAAAAMMLLVPVLGWWVRLPVSAPVEPRRPERRSAPPGGLRLHLDPMRLRRNEDILHSPHFWALLAIFFIASGAGLMVIAGMIDLMVVNRAEPPYHIIIALFAIFNGIGRVVFGRLADQWRRKPMLTGVIVLEAVTLWTLAHSIHTSAMFYVAIALIASAYGGLMVVAAAFLRENWGGEGFHRHHAWLFIGWGLGGAMFSHLNEWISVKTGDVSSGYQIAATFMIIATVLSVAIRESRCEVERRTTSRH
jgi:OFA family oxalate/formate antiporter-like MFS transporter